jgi:hypothetical protein
VQPRMGIRRRSILVVYVCLECTTKSTSPWPLLPLVAVVSATVFSSCCMMDGGARRLRTCVSVIVEQARTLAERALCANG